MSTKELIKKVEERFHQKLEAKNGWGKNEVKNLFQEALSEVLLEVVEPIIIDYKN